MRHILLLFLCLAVPAAAQTKRLSPVVWKLELDRAEARPGGIAAAKLTAKIEEPWHLYSPTTPAGGPIVTTLAVEPNDAVESAEIYRPNPVRKPDPNFNIDTETYEKEAVFLIKVKLKAAAKEQPFDLTVNMRYQVCNETQCLPPVRRSASATINVRASAQEIPFSLPAGYAMVAAAAQKTPPPSSPPAPKESLGSFALLAFTLGLAAIFTPCVFPMIPFTMTYFLNRRQANRADGVLQAAVFSLGIVLLFTSLGLLITALLGPFGVVQLGSNPWVNTFIAAIFFALAISLLGAFEITLPSSLLTKMNAASDRGGILGSLLMGLTFSLTSFACVGPFVGTLLAASVQGDKVQPAIGMLAFSAGLASPFFFLALFPAAMSNLPKSGSWLPRVKIVMGFVLLAMALKYVSNIDQVMQWNFLTRERFLAAWAVLFALPGLYLLGFLRMEGVKPEAELGPGRAIAGAVFLIFSLSLLPGMAGGKLGDLEAYIPLAAEGSTVSSASGRKLTWMKNQYQEALALAKRENKRVLVNFTGYACTNCHWMKANMFPRPEVAAELENMVLVELYTDGSDAVSEKNQEFQNGKFATVAIPFYVVMDGDEKVLATFPRLTRNAQEFVAFLRTPG
ncbi:MAG: thioredoxin family protein [Candidatus Solibacter usitatus]|nr:thioredoxin family protein [Candidatus Solibacter usitatus]